MLLTLTGGLKTTTLRLKEKITTEGMETWISFSTKGAERLNLEAFCVSSFFHRVQELERCVQSQCMLIGAFFILHFKGVQGRKILLTSSALSLV
jgi:hypothetical protein